MPEGEADGDTEADGEADADADADGDADSDAVGDGSTDPDAGNDGSGTGVGSGMKREGMPAMDKTSTRTKMANTVRIHGRARRSSREGREPR